MKIKGTKVFSTIVLLAVASIGYGDYKVVWHTMDGGCGTSSGGQYQLTGTIAQPDAGNQAGGPYELLGGFWVGGPLCIVNLEHFANFAAFWLDGPCDADNNWCGGGDLNRQADVNIDDLTILASQWLNICPYAWPLK